MLTMERKLENGHENEWTDVVVDSLGLGLITEDWLSSTMIWHTKMTSMSIYRSPGHSRRLN